MKKKKQEVIILDPSSDEYQIAIEQLSRLRSISKERLLTTDEVKMYDLLVKNLQLTKGKPTDINAEYKKEEPELIDIIDIARGGVLGENKVLTIQELVNSDEPTKETVKDDSDRSDL